MEERNTSSNGVEAANEPIEEEPFDPAGDEDGEEAEAGDASAASGAAESAGSDAGEGAAGPGGAEDAPAEPAAPSLEEQLADARKATERIRQQMLRVAADFDNFRKRTVRDLEDARRRARQGVVRDFLPVFDNLERAVAHAGDAQEPAAFSEGIRIVLKQFDDTLRKMDIHRVEAQGAPFDPSLHESIQLVESADHEVGTVVSVVQPGYRHGDELLRPALVAVSKGPPAPSTEPEDDSTAGEPSPAEATDRSPATDEGAGASQLGSSAERGAESVDDEAPREGADEGEV